MATAVKSPASKIREEVESRKAEVRKQLGPLEAELVELLSLVPDEVKAEPVAAAPKPAPAAPMSEAKPKQTRSRKGGRRVDQAVELIAAKPGIGVPEISKTMKIKPNYLYRVLGDAEKAGQVRKEGRSYFPIAA